MIFISKKLKIDYREKQTFKAFFPPKKTSETKASKYIKQFKFNFIVRCGP